MGTAAKNPGMVVRPQSVESTDQLASDGAIEAALARGFLLWRHSFSRLSLLRRRANSASDAPLPSDR
jgi:hypothetical protein